MTAVILSSSLFCAAFLLIRALARRRLDPRVTYALWLVMLVRLALPISLGEVALSLPSMAEERDAPETFEISTETSQPAQTEPPPPYIPPETSSRPIETESPTINVHPLETETVYEPIITDIVEPEAPTPTPEPYEKPKPSPAKILALVRLIGGVLTAAGFAVSAMSFSAKVRRDRRLLGDYKGVKVYASEGAGGSCLAGLVPAIYLTPEVADEGKRELVIMHEYTHLTHGDSVWNVARAAICSVWWWNPLVWCAALLSRRDSELACDASVASRLGIRGRLDYARLLVNASERKPLPVGLSGGQLRERVLRLTESPKPSRLAAIIAALLTLTLASCSFVGARLIPAGHSLVRGRYVEAKVGHIILLEGDGACSFDLAEGIELPKLTSGDRIELEIDALLDSSPMQTTAYNVRKLDDGLVSDLDNETLIYLDSLGHIELSSLTSELDARFVSHGGLDYLVPEAKNPSPIQIELAEGVTLEGLDDGDLVRVKIGAIYYTNPTRTTIYSVEKLKDGSLRSVDRDALEAIADNKQSFTGRYLERGRLDFILTEGILCTAILLTPADAVEIPELTSGDRIRVDTGALSVGTPPRATFYEVEKLADGEESDLDAAQLERVPFYTELTGRWYSQEGEYIFLDDYSGEVVPCKITRKEYVTLPELTNGDRVSVTVLTVGETYPLQAEIYRLEKLADGELGDIDATALAKLLELRQSSVRESYRGIYQARNGRDYLILELNGELVECRFALAEGVAHPDLVNGGQYAVTADYFNMTAPVQATFYSIEPDDSVPDEIRQAFKEAEEIFAAFTGYGIVEELGETLESDGHTYVAVKVADCTTLEKLRAAVYRSFEPELAESLLATEVGGAPLYIDRDGKLWRLGGYAGQWGYDIGYSAIMTLADGRLSMKLATTKASGEFITSVATCELGSSGKFATFELPAEKLFAAYTRESPSIEEHFRAAERLYAAFTGYGIVESIGETREERLELLQRHFTPELAEELLAREPNQPGSRSYDEYELESLTLSGSVLTLEISGTIDGKRIECDAICTLAEDGRFSSFSLPIHRLVESYIGVPGAVFDAFPKAEALYAAFTPYGEPTQIGAEYMLDGVMYESVEFGEISDMASLKSSLGRYFTAELVDELLTREDGGHPIFVESGGQLLRLESLNSGSSCDVGERRLTQENGRLRISVASGGYSASAYCKYHLVGESVKFESFELPAEKLELARLTEAFAEAEALYAAFTPYGEPTRIGSSRTIGGVAYEPVRVVTAGDMATLRALLHGSFTSELAEELLASKHNGSPIFVEHNGVLHRLVSIVGDYGYSEGSREYSLESGRLRVQVTSGFAAASAFCDYIIEDGRVKFSTFELPAERLESAENTVWDGAAFVVGNAMPSDAHLVPLARYGAPGAKATSTLTQYGYHVEIHAPEDGERWFVFGLCSDETREVSELVTYRVVTVGGVIVSAVDSLDNLLLRDLTETPTHSSQLKGKWSGASSSGGTLREYTVDFDAKTISVDGRVLKTSLDRLHFYSYRGFVVLKAGEGSELPDKYPLILSPIEDKPTHSRSSIPSEPLKLWVESAASRHYELHTASGEYIGSIPTLVTAQFPASDRTDEQYSSFGYLDGIDAYAGRSGDFIWCVVATGPSLGSGNHNLCVSHDGGTTWEVRDRRTMLSGTVIGAGFESESVGYVCYRFWEDNGPKIAITEDGGFTWRRLEIEVPADIAKLGINAESPKSDASGIYFPIRIYSGVNLVGTSELRRESDGEWRFTSVTETAGGYSEADGKPTITDLTHFALLGEDVSKQCRQFFFDLLSGESEIPEYNALKIANWSITRDDSLGEGFPAFRFEFDVTGEPSGRLTKGHHVKYVHDVKYTYMEDAESPPQPAKQLSENAERVIKYINSSYIWDMGWDNESYPHNYAASSESGTGVPLEEYLETLRTTFGIENPSEELWKSFAYEKDGKTYVYDGEIDSEWCGNIVNEYSASGMTVVTVQFYAEMNGILPSHRVEYVLTDDGRFDHTNVKESSYEPCGLKRYYTE